jgi:hypothetical protein
MRIRIWTLAALAALGPGCGGGDSLEGTWLYSTNVDGEAISELVTLNSDGSATDKVTISGGCKGTLTGSGFDWTSTATTLTFSGKPSCKGTVACTVLGTTVSKSCESSGANSLVAGACTYKFSNGGNTLTLTDCTTATGNAVWTRQ